MKKLILIVFIFTSFLAPMNKAHALDAKSKAFMIMCTYGTIGGALLGFASMAFGTNSRAIAQGASLGLYAGIAFGAFVITSHNQQSTIDPYQEQPAPPPPSSGFGAPLGDSYDQGGFGGQDSEGGGGFFGDNRAVEIQENLFSNYRLKNKKSREISLPIYVNLINYQF